MTTEVPEQKAPVNYGNSNAAKANAQAITEAEKTERAPVKKIEGVQVIEKKPTLGSRFAKVFAGENLKTIGKGVVVEILLPGARDIVFDMIKEGTHKALYGNTSTRSTIGATVVQNAANRIRTTNYSTMSASPLIVGSQQVGQQALTSQEKAKFDFTRLIFPEHAMALEVLERLNDAIIEFNIVTVADFYDFIGQTGNGFTDQKHGWNAQAFAGAEVRRAHGGGYYLFLPQPREIG
jgi:hypothetical protein